jgi:hypothetical protein
VVLKIAVSCVLAVAGCGAEEVEAPIGSTEPEASSEIYGGSTDTTHDAVVYLEGAGSCTGTIVSASGGTGWVLTAGHCGGIQTIYVGDNLNNYDVAFNVTQDIPHPSWNGDAGQGYDFRLLRFSFSGGTPPVIPPASDDSGIIGKVVTHVGYGLTENGPTSQRRAVNQPVQNAYANPPLLEFDQSNGTGTCSGDSGGPALYNGAVVGVTSFGDSQCIQDGYSGRVAAVYDWIAQYAEVGPPPPPTCNECIGDATSTGGDCSDEWAACPGTCSELDTCYAQCASGDTACYQSCDTTYPAAVGPLQAVYDCLCLAATCGEICGCTDEPSGTGAGGGTGSGSGAGAGSGASGPSSGSGTDGSGAGDAGGEGPDRDDADDVGPITGVTCAIDVTHRGDGGKGRWALLGLLGLALARSRRRA